MRFFKFSRPHWDARRVIYQTLLWSKASYLFIAIAAAIASSIRTILAISENYAASGAPPWAVVLGAFCFTLVAEIAIFVLAIAQEDQMIKWRLAHKKRHITTLRTIKNALTVRLGFKEPLSYDQLPENDGGVGGLILLAFSFAIVTNLYIGLRPLINQMGAASIQSFIGHLLNANADVQFAFVIDLAAALFPPFVELIAGRLNARYAASVSASQRGTTATKKERTKAAPVDTPERSNEDRSNRSNAGRSGAKQRVIEWLNEHPDITNQHEVARQTGASLGTVNNAFKTRIAEPNHGSNSNHNGNGV